MNIDEIEVLIKLFESSSLSELSLAREKTKLVLKRELNTLATVTSTATSPSAAPEPTSPPTPTLATDYTVTSPLVGTFYRRPSPEEPSYVEIGTRVKAGDTLCIVEAMKVMNEIKAERAGTVTEILVEDAHIVEYGQPLIVLDPS